MSTVCLHTETHPSWCDETACLRVDDWTVHSSAAQYWKTSTEGQEVCLWLSQTPGEAPRVILGDANAPEEHTLLLTIAEAADLIGRLAPLVAAAMPGRGCPS